MAFPTPTRSTWMAALNGFQRSSSYPAAIGALDGKHIACVVCVLCQAALLRSITVSWIPQRPSHSGSAYYNSKGFYSIVLLAVVDADYRCLLYYLGKQYTTQNKLGNGSGY